MLFDGAFKVLFDFFDFFSDCLLECFLVGSGCRVKTLTRGWFNDCLDYQSGVFAEILKSLDALG